MNYKVKDHTDLIRDNNGSIQSTDFQAYKSRLQKKKQEKDFSDLKKRVEFLEKYILEEKN